MGVKGPRATNTHFICIVTLHDDEVVDARCEEMRFLLYHTPPNSRTGKQTDSVSGDDKLRKQCTVLTDVIVYKYASTREHKAVGLARQ